MFVREFNTPRGVARYSTPEVTALELVGYPKHAGGIANVAMLLGDLAKEMEADVLARPRSPELGETRPGNSS